MLQLPALYAGVHRKSALYAELTGDLQKFLLGRGYLVQVDANYGPKTTAVVSQFQKDNKLFVDGRVGPKTWGALLMLGFQPQSFEEEEKSLNWPPKPSGAVSPNGVMLFGGKNFSYAAAPVPKNPEAIIINPVWVAENIETIQIPQLKKFGAGWITVNKKLSPQFRKLFEVWEQLGHLNKILTFDGAWVPRFVRGRTDKVSNHSMGSAIDLNAKWNGFRTTPAQIGEMGCIRELVLPAYELGFYWGGWYNDGMHLEAYKVVN